jgi:hypothetical protein
MLRIMLARFQQTTLAITIDHPFGYVLFSAPSYLLMKIIRTEKQRENLAKYFWDMSKVAFAVLVAGPFAKPESFSSAGLLIGIAIGFLLALWGYLHDGMEVSK